MSSLILNIFQRDVSQQCIVCAYKLANCNWKLSFFFHPFNQKYSLHTSVLFSRLFTIALAQCENSLQEESNPKHIHYVRIILFSLDLPPFLCKSLPSFIYPTANQMQTNRENPEELLCINQHLIVTCKQCLFMSHIAQHIHTRQKTSLTLYLIILAT